MLAIEIKNEVKNFIHFQNLPCYNAFRINLIFSY